MIRILLSDLLRIRGWTQRDLAFKARVREATVSHMCNNKVDRINLAYLDRICMVLDCDVDDIVQFIRDENYI